MFADGRLKFCFSFTQDLLRESGRFFQQGTTEKAACKGECEARRKSAEGRVCLSKAHRRH